MSKLGSYLKKQRQKMGITHAKVAENVAISADTVAKHERGKRVPKLRALLSYSRFYHVSIYKLIDLAIEDIEVYEDE